MPVTLTVAGGGIGAVNLALGKPATQSSTYEYPSAVAASAVDGNTDGNFFARLGDRDEPRIEPMVAGGPRQIDAYSIDHRLEPHRLL